MQELSDFYNAGFGWICRHCERHLGRAESIQRKHSRLMTEGEAEGKQPAMSNHALAKWMDKMRTTLVCPRCGITEQVYKN